MLLKEKEVAIIGGGPGGLTLARLLQLQDVQVKVYERDLDKNARVQGSPLDLHDESGLAAITKAGLLEEFKKHFMAGADRTVITNLQAEVLYSDHDHPKEEDFGHQYFRPEIDRGVLRRMLLDSLKPGTVVWDSHFISMEALQSMDAKSRMNPGTIPKDIQENPKEANQRDHHGWTMHFKNGSSAYADLVIAADGANSKLRPYVTDIKPFFSGITMLEGNVYHAEKKVPNISALLKGGKIMAFGNKQDILMGQKGNGEIGFYASFYSDEDWAKTSGINFSDNEAMLSWFKKEYAGWSHVWDELFLQATTPFIPRPIYCIPFDQAWEPLPNLTLLGDAAHVMPPFAGEGVNMAMLDALELSEVFASPGVNSLHHAIAQYEISMRKRASSIAKESLENGQRMHAENALETMLDFFQGK